MAGPQGALHLGDLAVDAGPHPVGGGLHLERVGAVAVPGGLPGHQVETGQREAVAAREGVAPADVLVEAHLHARRTEQRHAVHVELARDGEVALPEPGLAAPGEVRVGHHQPVARRGGVAAERPAVAGRPGFAATEGGDGRRRVGAVGAGGLGPPDDLHQVPAAAQQGDVAQVGVQVELVDRSHPRRPGAPLRQEVAGHRLGQPGVVAGRVPRDEIPDERRLGVSQRGGAVGDAEHQVAEVAGQVLALVARPQVERPLAADLHDLVGDGGQVVAGAGPPLAEAQAGPVGGSDVGHPVGGPADVGVEHGSP